MAMMCTMCHRHSALASCTHKAPTGFVGVISWWTDGHKLNAILHNCNKANLLQHIEYRHSNSKLKV